MSCDESFRRHLHRKITHKHGPDGDHSHPDGHHEGQKHTHEEFEHEHKINPHDGHHHPEHIVIELSPHMVAGLIEEDKIKKKNSEQKVGSSENENESKRKNND